jgi:hypothetical protein
MDITVLASRLRGNFHLYVFSWLFIFLEQHAIATLQKRPPSTTVFTLVVIYCKTQFQFQVRKLIALHNTNYD